MFSTSFWSGEACGLLISASITRPHAFLHFFGKIRRPAYKVVYFVSRANTLFVPVNVYADILRCRMLLVERLRSSIDRESRWDLRVCHCFLFQQVDNSALTGESEAISRSTNKTSDNPMETQNLAFFGTLAVRGKGQGAWFLHCVFARLCEVISSMGHILVRLL